MKRPISIWSSVEMSAASRDFDYVDYLHLHNQCECKGAVLSPVTYDLVVKILNTSIEEQMASAAPT